MMQDILALNLQPTIDWFFCLKPKNKRISFIAMLMTGLHLTFKVASAITKRKRRVVWKEESQDMVILHMIPRGRLSPNISPFPLKVETYLRMAKIPHKIDFSEPMGAKDKTPWMTLNGEEIYDSQIMVEYLGKKYGVDFSKDLSEKEKATGRAFQIMAEEHLYWGLVMWRYVFDNDNRYDQIQAFPAVLKPLIPFIARPKLRKQAWNQGVGRHSEKEVTQIMVQDLEAISVFLGDKHFLFGEKATEYDCAIFGMLAQFVWNMPGSPYERMMDDKFANLNTYCYRMKETFWPDWESCLYNP